MKNLFYIFFIALLFVSCGSARMNDAVVVEQINVMDNNKDNDNDRKYEVKLKTADGGADAFYYTNFRFQVGDTLVSLFEFFDGKNNDIRRLSRENDSLKKELDVAIYYLQILKERIIIDTIKRK